jgi:drug/metabolite transporter (DMT)-like permease
MMKLSLYLCLFAVSHCVFLSYGFWIVRQTDRMELFGITFSSIWMLWIAALLMATPVLAMANILIGGTFYFGFKEYKSAWMVLLMFIGAQVIAYPAMTYLWFKEIPHKGAFIGACLALAGLATTYLWKR